MLPEVRVDRYRLIDRVGAGGMGEVYRALDERLGRQVALKLLPAAQSTPPDRQLRFLREAQAASALQHPGIVTVHDIGVHGDRPFLVMELVDGQSFSALAQDGVTPGEALRLCAEVADALSAAHARGILHRDIKSANLMRTLDGRVKVVDFGLAKLLDARGLESSDAVVAWLTSSSPRHAEPPAPDVTADGSGTVFRSGDPPAELDATVPAGHLDSALTRMGDVLGTPAYMAPEQTEGAPVTPQSEVFSLGVVLYELLAGRRPFSAPTVAETLGLVAECRPAPPSRAAGRPLPDGVDRLVLRALARDPAARPKDMRHFAAALRALAAPRRPRRLPLWLGLGAVLGAAGLAVGTIDRAGFVFRPKDLRRLTFGEGCEEFPSLSPDGRSVYFDAAEGRDYHVFALEVASGRQRRLTGAAGWQYAASLSPDGTQVAYLAVSGGRAAAEIVPADGGGPPRRIASGGARPLWTPDGRALWAGSLGRPARHDAATGAVSRTLEPPRGFLLSHVRELADGRLLVRLMESGASGGVGIGVYEPGAAEPRWLLRDTVEEVLEPTPDGGSVIAARMTPNHRMELWRLPLDGGAAAPLPTSEVPATKGLVLSPRGDRMVWSTCAGIPGFAWLGDGAGGLALTPLPRSPSEDWTDTAPFGVPGTSLLAMSSDRTGRDQPWVVDLAGREPARLLAIPGAESGYPAVSPDRRWLAYAVLGKGLYLRPFAGEGPARVLAADPGDAPPAFSRASDRVFYEAREPAGIAVVPLAGGPAERLLEPGARAPSAVVSSDLLAYLAPGPEPGAAAPRLHDLAAGQGRPLSPALPPGAYSALALAPDGTRAAAIVGQKELVEVALPSGEVLRRLDAGGDQLIGCTYADGKLIASRVAWRGDLWIADDPLR